MIRSATAAAAVLVLGGSLLARQQGEASGVYTREQAERGRAALRSNSFGACSDCHTEALTGRVGNPDERPALASLPAALQKTIGSGGRVPDLVGPAFRSRWATRSTRELSADFEKRFAFTLSEETRLNILAFVLSENGFRPGSEPLTMTTDVLIGTLDGPRPTFDVASIRINRSGEDRVSGGFLPGGRFAATNYSLRSLVAAAYLRPQINPDFLVAGGPAWIDSTRFDVNAKAAQEWPSGPDGPTAPRRVMLQNLLADRFGLRTHTEARPAGVYRLVRIDERTLGPQLRPADPDCSSSRSAGQVAVPIAAAPCQISIGPGYVLMRRARLSQFVNLLPRFVNRVVENDTRLDDAVDLELHWAPVPGEWVAPGTRADDGDRWPALPTAIQEQLGLRLVPQRGEVEYLVIDAVHLPGAN